MCIVTGLICDLVFDFDWKHHPYPYEQVLKFILSNILIWFEPNFRQPIIIKHSDTLIVL